MLNEEIITGLRNAVENGESLQEAMQIMINTGYSPREVQEASKFIGGGILQNNIPKPEENLVFPEKKSFLSNLNLFKKNKIKFVKPNPENQEINKIKKTIYPNSSPINSTFQQNTSQQNLSKQNISQQTSAVNTSINKNINQVYPDNLSKQIKEEINQSNMLMQKNNSSPTPNFSFSESNQGNFSKELNKITPKKSYTKEIFLLVTLIFLIGLLIATILFKETILGWFS
jgi:hypothetical protein